MGLENDLISFSTLAPSNCSVIATCVDSATSDFCHRVIQFSPAADEDEKAGKTRGRVREESREICRSSCGETVVLLGRRWRRNVADCVLFLGRTEKCYSC